MSYIKQYLYDQMTLTCLPTCNLKNKKRLIITYQQRIQRGDQRPKKETRCVEFANIAEACEWLNYHWPQISNRTDSWITDIGFAVPKHIFDNTLKFIDTKEHEEPNQEPTHQGTDG